MSIKVDDTIKVDSTESIIKAYVQNEKKKVKNSDDENFLDALESEIIKRIVKNGKEVTKK